MIASTTAQKSRGLSRLSTDQLVQRLEAIGANPRRSGVGWSFRCILHDDDSPSATLLERDGRVLVNCFACRSTHGPGFWSAFLTRLAEGTPLPPAAPSSRFSRSGSGHRGAPVAFYDYRARDGTMLARKVRYDPKPFGWQRPFLDGWCDGLGHRPITSLPFYVVARLAAADMQSVLLVESEKSVQTALAAGHLATCGPAGSGPLPDDLTILARRTVTLVVDRDGAGTAWAKRCISRLTSVGCTVIAARTPLDKPGADLHDHLEAGFRLDQLQHGRTYLS